MKVRLTATAEKELDRILAYIEADNPDAAKRVGVAIEQALDWIRRWPLASPIVPGQRVRSKLVPRYQCRIYYAVTQDDVVIRNIRSTRQLRPWEKPKA
jgi:plasmid stabilization system protein ParE